MNNSTIIGLQMEHERAWAVRDAALIEAMISGMGLRELARLTGLSPEGVKQIAMRGGATTRRRFWDNPKVTVDTTRAELVRAENRARSHFGVSLKLAEELHLIEPEYLCLVTA